MGILDKSYYPFGDRCGWSVKLLTECESSVSVKSAEWSVQTDTVREFGTVKCGTPDETVDENAFFMATTKADDRCGIPSAYVSDLVATPEYCQLYQDYYLNPQCAVTATAWTCYDEGTGYATGQVYKALSCPSGRGSSGWNRADDCEIIDVICDSGGGSCYKWEGPDARAGETCSKD